MTQLHRCGQATTPSFPFLVSLSLCHTQTIHTSVVSAIIAGDEGNDGSKRTGDECGEGLPVKQSSAPATAPVEPARESPVI
mmetsp:Transcript_40055/g.120717  ORF Transcript_40055/g.120717 Transcript_40055/m.120717 type:complete len:81 (+) Transcript_40055:2000-2242(+)